MAEGHLTHMQNTQLLWKKFKQNVGEVALRDRDTHRFFFWTYITCNRDTALWKLGTQDGPAPSISPLPG